MTLAKLGRIAVVVVEETDGVIGWEVEINDRRRD
jgi:hypothetical protein